MNRNTLAAKKIRAELILKLGAKCAKCGETEDDKLEFDHIHGRAYDVNKLSYRQRMTRYRDEAARNLIRILCGVCNRAERKKHENGSFCRTCETPLRTMELQPIVEVEI